MHTLSIRVYYEDTDFSGVVYHANYLKYFERARTEWLRMRGISHSQMGAGSLGEPLAFTMFSDINPALILQHHCHQQ